MNNPFTKKNVKEVVESSMLYETMAERFNIIAEAHYKQQTRWIPVEDRFPTPIERYESWHRSEELMLYNKRKDKYYIGYYHEGVYGGREFKEWYDADDFELIGISHWRRIERPE